MQGKGNGSFINDYWQIDNLKMINWGVYNGGPHTIDFAKGETGSLTMVTGNSGTGKSTVLDALMTLLFKSGRQMNQASSQGQEKDKRSIYSYVRGYINETEDPDTGRNVVSYFRGTDTNGNKLPVWAAVSLTLSNAAGGQITIAGFFYIKAGETKNATKFWILSRDSVELLSAERIASSMFTARRIRELYPAALVVSDNKEDMRRKYHEIVGITERAEDLLYRILTGAAESDVTRIFRNIVLDVPDTIEMAAALVAQYDQCRQTIDSWENKVKKQKAFDHLRRLNDRYEELRKLAAPYGTIGSEQESAAEIDGIQRWHSNRFSSLLNEKLTALQDAQGVLQSDITRFQVDFELASEKLTQAQKAFAAGGGSALKDLDAEIKNAKNSLASVKSNKKRFESLFEEIGEEIPAQEDVWTNRYNDLERENISVPKRIKQLDETIENLQEDLAVTKKSRDLARADFNRAERLRTRITAEMELARQTISNATGIDSGRLQYAAEMFDLAEGYDDWRAAANLALVDIADCLLVDDVEREVFLKGIAALPADSIGHRCKFRFVRRSGYGAEVLADTARLSGRLKFKKGPFADELMSILSMSGIDCLCVDEGFDENTPYRQLKINGMLRDADGGVHGYRTVPNIIGFVDQAELDHLKNHADMLDKQVNDIEDNLSSRCAEKKRIEGERRLYVQMQSVSFSDIDFATAEFKLDSLIKQKDVLVGNNELEGLKNAVDVADRERLDANERLREAERTLKDSKVQAIAYSKCIEALDLKLSNRIDLLDPADETIDILERIFPSESDARGVSHLGFDSLIKYIDEQEKKFLSDLRKESKGKQSAVIAAQREVEREMKYCKEAFGASTPELDHVDTDIRDIAAYLSMDLSGSEQALVDVFASNLPKINLAFKNFSECEREYETDVLSAFSTINGILKRYPFRSDGAALEIKPTFQKNTSAYLAVREMIRSVVSDEYDNASDYRNMAIDELKGKLDAIGTVIDYLRPDKLGNPSKVADSRQRLRVKVTAGEGDNAEIINSAASMNGGRREKVKAFILSAALFYTLKSSADERPLFAPILFDEAFIKSDMDTTQTAIKAMLGFGFQLFISCPDGKQAAILPMTDMAWFVTRADEMSPACLNPVRRVKALAEE